MFIDCIV